MTGCASEDAEVDELGEEEDSEPPELYSGDVSRAMCPRSTHLRMLLVLLLTQLVYLFVFLGAPRHKGRVPGVTPSQAQTNNLQSLVPRLGGRPGGGEGMESLQGRIDYC